MSVREENYEIDVGMIAAKVELINGDIEEIISKGYTVSVGSSFIAKDAEDVMNYRIKRNLNFESRSGCFFFGDKIVKILSKKTYVYKVKYKKIYTKFLFFPEEFSHYEIEE